MPGRHPDDDLLADLAADVLPVEQARTVEAHVLECDRCAGLLSDAEHVRRLLLADDPGPVPPEVWGRIEAALNAEASRQVQGDGLRATPASASEVAVPSAAGSGDGAGWDGPDPLDDPGTWAGAGDGSPRVDLRGAVAPVTGNLRRLTTSRRDARSDRRSDTRPWAAPALLAAAAVVAIVAIAGTVRLVQSAGSGGASAGFASASEASSSSAASGQGGAAAAANGRILASGTKYTTASLAAQARALVPGRGKGAATRTDADQSAHGGTGVPAPVASASQERSTEASAAPRASGPPPRGLAVTPDPRATDIRNPQRLAACLAALDAPRERLVALDLATFDGREAAVLVLTATAGGYEVFVVERTCAPGHEGTLDYTTLPG